MVYRTENYFRIVVFFVNAPPRVCGWQAEKEARQVLFLVKNSSWDEIQAVELQAWDGRHSYVVERCDRTPVDRPAQIVVGAPMKTIRPARPLTTRQVTRIIEEMPDEDEANEGDPSEPAAKRGSGWY
jgi:hypothetical protein